MKTVPKIVLTSSCLREPGTSKIACMGEPHSRWQTRSEIAPLATACVDYPARNRHIIFQ
jgi:hypothetical protein